MGILSTIVSEFPVHSNICHLNTMRYEQWHTKTWCYVDEGQLYPASIAIDARIPGYI